jgi:GxxExxY protein
VERQPSALALALRRKSTTEEIPINTEDTGKNHQGTHGLVHGSTTTAILSAAYRVHGRLGPGLLERVYQACLSHELARMGIPFETEKMLPVAYDGLHIDLGYRVDFLVESRVIVEIKAVDTILPVHEAQLLTYLRLSGIRVGLLINVNTARLQAGIRRRIVGY